jgi:methylase of polypeptide subunit release factors
MRLGRRPPPETSFPPPAGASAAVLAALSALHARSKRAFLRAFLFEEPLEADPAEAAPLLACGLLEGRGERRFLARARVFPLFEKFVAADLLSYQREDQVLSPMFEHLYLLRNTSVRGGDEVLDLHAGCGGTAIFAAEIARSVTAVDASPRALAFARFNAQLNPPRAPVALLAGPPAEGTFDVVLAIPPFEMLPPGERRFLHSDGGADGLDAVRACLARAQGLL